MKKGCEGEFDSLLSRSSLSIRPSLGERGEEIKEGREEKGEGRGERGDQQRTEGHFSPFAGQVRR